MSTLDKITITETVLKDESDEFLNKLFDFWDILFRESDADDPLPPRKMRFQNVRNPHPHSTNFNWVATDSGDNIIGSGGMDFSNEKSPEYEDNKHSAWMGINIHPNNRNQGLGRKILLNPVKKAKDYGKGIIQTGTEMATGQAFAESFGVSPSQVGGENRLRMADIDWDMLRAWVDEGPKRAENVKLVEFQNAPDDLIDAYIEIYTETMNQQPLGEIEWTYKGTTELRRIEEDRVKERDTLWFTLISQEDDGAISGLTEIFFNRNRPFRLVQNLTGVKDKYRGRGLGKWLKAELLLRMHKRYPDVKYIVTGNADSNAPMLSINSRMGFKKHKSWKTYKYTTDDLLDKLK